ncbi:MAG TPA: ABC transporter substrate-binding protein [Candidatus Limnocylindrales bacterium]|nr:ABC transporter substrate-binding protein [Candidatus Limnocylindrales bacterium]
MTHPRCYLFRALLSALVILLLSVGADAAELKKFRLGYSTVGPAGTGLWMAKEIGAFEKYGVDADLIFISSGPVVVQALIGGDLQGGFAATNAVIAAVLGGAPLVSIMSLVNRPYYRLWVQPEISRIEELRGKTLGVSRFGSVTDNMTRILLRKKNLEGAVNVRQFGGTTEMAAAFLHRQIAGAVISALRVNAPMRILVDLSELDFLYSNVVITVSRDFQRRAPETLEAFARGYLEGVAATHGQREKALKVIQKYTRLKDQKLIEELYSDSSKFLERVPRVEPEAIAPIVEFMGKKPIAVESFADNSIVDRLVREGFIDKLYKRR